MRGSLSHHSLTDTGCRVCVSCNIVLVVNNYCSEKEHRNHDRDWDPNSYSVNT